MKTDGTRKIKIYNGKYEEERVVHIWSEQEYRSLNCSEKLEKDKELISLHLALFNSILTNQNHEIIADIEGLQSIRFYDAMARYCLKLKDKINGMTSIINRYEYLFSQLIELKEDIKEDKIKVFES